MEKTNTTKEKAIYTEIKERVEETRREDKRFSELWDKMEKSLTTKEKKEFENTILCFKGAFKSFLENIKEKYSKDKNLWGKNKFQQKKKVP